MFTAEAQSSQSLFFILLSVERPEIKKQSASGKYHANSKPPLLTLVL
jgi:hypothetical protein